MGEEKNGNMEGGLKEEADTNKQPPKKKNAFIILN